MFYFVIAYPRSQHRFCLFLIVQNHNVQWFNCTITGYGHLVESGSRGRTGHVIDIIIYLTVYHWESFIQFNVRIIIFSSHIVGHAQQSHYGTCMYLSYANVVQHCHHIDHGQLDFFFELVGVLHTSNYHSKRKSGQ